MPGPPSKRASVEELEGVLAVLPVRADGPGVTETMAKWRRPVAATQRRREARVRVSGGEKQGREREAGQHGVVVAFNHEGGPGSERGSSATAAWHISAAHCGDSEEGDDVLAKNPLAIFNQFAKRSISKL